MVVARRVTGGGRIGQLPFRSRAYQFYMAGMHQTSGKYRMSSACVVRVCGGWSQMKIISDQTSGEGTEYLVNDEFVFSVEAVGVMVASDQMSGKNIGCLVSREPSDVLCVYRMSGDQFSDRMI